ncbi:uncharacterized protein LOC118477121 [Aplysia californica]|uniref:Uncharacterized protein LOC118477121 n=1 Tax=Aplysia californica TaxID=6500 RepID=A0ABM1VS89_APLCA|nr:uncharacterized protein LOC118477121 [Aplysia californica]
MRQEWEVVAEISEAGGRILMVSFGERHGALKWLEETQCPYDMVLDGKRTVWSIACMVYYAEQLVAGRELPKPFENVHDDPQQMGGDFVLDRQGVIKLSYPSKTSSDRPSVDQLLAAMTVNDPDSLPSTSKVQTQDK